VNAPGESLRLDGQSTRGVMPALQSGWIELGVLALLFLGLQIWWLTALARRRALARPLSEAEFRQALERIWIARSRS
jgi:hypothetical protein